MRLIRKKGRARKLVGLLILFVLVWSGLAMFSDAGKVVESVRQISARRIVLVLGLSGINYWIRIIRFNWLTERVARVGIKKEINSVIFFSGLAMNLTPVRIGEVIKAYFQQKLFGESFARMAPIVLIERLTDALAMLALMSFGVLALRTGRGTFGILVVITVMAVVGLHRRGWGGKLIRVLGKLPGGGKMVRPISRALRASFRLTGWRPLLVSTFLGVAAWAAEAAGLWVLLLGTGVAFSLKTMYLAMFIFAMSAAAGFISVIPAGLGINELSTIGLLEALMGVGYSEALVATFAFRLVTLWFGILLGAVSLLYLEKKVEAK